MFQSKSLRVFLFAQIAILLLFVVVTSEYVSTKETVLVTQIESNVYESHTKARALALATSKNNGTKEVDELIEDCSRRTEFENLLIRLETLENNELRRADELLESCGSYFSLKKSLTTLLFKNSVDELALYNALLERVSTESPYTENVRLLSELTEMEQTRSDLLKEQVLLQKKVIEELVRGNDVNDVSVQVLTQRARQIIEILSVMNKQIESKREYEKNIKEY